ncbi:MAG: carboxypeptidase-like regulatory domain-containing protein [Muribaculaceae bacterium]|nr:carboxypeptidase-like regulatory domain-containing protein [Muribaculaceae bacterium]
MSIKEIFKGIMMIMISVVVTLSGFSSCSIGLNAQNTKGEIKIYPDTLDEKILTKDLDEVVIYRKKNKYSKKNNPAVELVKRIRRDRDVTDPTQLPKYSYEKYEKTLIGTTDFNLDFNKLPKSQQKFRFMEQFIDTAPWTGKRMLDLSLLEKSSIHLKGKEPKVDKEIVTGRREQGINEMFDTDNIRKMLTDVLREIDIYDNDLNLLQNRFVSPLSGIGPDFYMYHITDTVYFGGENCIEISFAPKTPETFGFNGHLYIPRDDSVKYVKRVSMRVPKAINVNYIDNIFVSQNYEKDSIGRVHKVLDDLSLEISILKSIPPVFASRQTRYKSFSYSDVEGFSEYYTALGDEFEEENAFSRSEEYWAKKRTIPFSYAESNMTNLVPYMRKVKALYWGEKILRILFQGYVGTRPKNSKFNVGPVNTFISYNDVEGLRLKAGGMTTSSFSDRFFLRGYGAYGFKDHKWKYKGELEYSFIKKKLHSREFPMNGIRATYQYDTDQIGVRYLYSNPDNVILSIRRKRNDLIIYKRLIQLEYNLELRNNLSFNLGYRHERSESTGWVAFRNGYGESFGKYNMGTFFATIRFAPGEKFVQTTSSRLPVNMDAPIFSISHEYGPKRLFGADFVMNKTEASFMKRFWFSAFGYANVLIKGGKIWSQVPFPSLLWQNSNLSYTIQRESFALLNPMEFAMDQYASWDLEYFVNGALFNRIPLIKKAKLREIVSFKGFFGGLTKRNNPEYNKNLYLFPTESHTMVMGKKPYMEIGVGIDNIFTLFRIDYVWRLTYRDNPDIDKRGVRISLHLSF